MTIRNRTVRPLKERIESRIFVRLDTGCWEWLGRIMPNGYGMLGIGQRSKGEKKTVYSHRLSYEVFIGPIPDGMDLDHLCRNRCCCNPAHLEPVTRSENSRRGMGAVMLGLLNSTKTHCAHGHEYSPANTIYRKGGGRSCRICRKRDKQKYVERKRKQIEEQP